jgi:hypothetical protein
MRYITRAILCAVALFAIAAPSAMANVLNLKTAAGSIASGGELKATSTNPVFQPNVGAKVTCTKSVEKGELKTNNVAKTKGLFSSITYEGCEQESKPVTIEPCASHLPWPTTLAEVIKTFGTKVIKGTGGGLCILVTYPSSLICLYEASGAESTFNIGGPETITTTEQRFEQPPKGKGSGACPKAGTLSETSTLTSNGESVEAVSEGGTGASPGSHPDWYECAKNKHGGLLKGCEESGGKGGYEVKPGVGKGKLFKGKGGQSILHNVIPTLGSVDDQVECASLKDEGHPAAPNLVYGVHVSFSKCKSLGHPCKSAGAKKEEIKTEALAGELGWISPGVAGVDLANEAHPGTGYVAEFECEKLAKARVLGSIIGTIGPLDAFSKETTFTYNVGKFIGPVEYEAGKLYEPIVNVPKFESGAPDFLATELNGEQTGFTWQPPGGLPSGEEAGIQNKGEELEIAPEP